MVKSLGRIPPDIRLEVPDRHLGLHVGAQAPLDGDARSAFGTRRGEGLTGEEDALFAERTLGTYCHTRVNSGGFDALVDAACQAVG